MGKVSRQIVNIWPYSALYNITVHRSSFRPLAGGGKELAVLASGDVPLHVVVRQWSLR